MPLVSVLMVFHRDTPFLRPAIASVRAQEFRDFELILVDNGTGLASDALGDAGRDPRVRWVRLERNLGIPGGHNAGVAAALGEFVALTDYDDLSMPQRLGRQLETLSRDPGLGLVSALATRIDEAGREVGHEFCLPHPAEHRSYAPYAAPVITPVAMARREVLRALPYRAEFPFAADLDFQARFVERGRMAVLPEALLQYRWHGGQTTQQRNREIEQSRCVVQILAGRRGAGRAEEIAALQAATAAESAGETWRRGARICLAEGYAAFAAYQARRSLALDRSLGGAWQALRLARSAARNASMGERRLVWRMFFNGPVRALQLHPAERKTAAPEPASAATARTA